LATLDEDLLAVGLNSGETVELVLEDLADRGCIDLDIVLLALVLDRDWKDDRLALQTRTQTAIVRPRPGRAKGGRGGHVVPGIVAILESVSGYPPRC